MKKSKYKLAHVEWIDSAGSGLGWGDVERAFIGLDILIHSIGYKVKEDKHYIYFANSISHINYEPEDYHFNGAFSIPKGCIKKIRYLND